MSSVKAAPAWIALSLLCVVTAASASEWATLLRLPVAGQALVPLSTVREALAGAGRADTPVDIALAVAGVFEGRRQLVAQANEGVESPTASRVTVLRDGLLDDAVRSERWDIDLVRTSAGHWEIKQVARAWRCRRGGQTARFSDRPCP